MGHPTPTECPELKSHGPYPEGCFRIYPGPPELDGDVPIATIHGDSEASEEWADLLAEAPELKRRAKQAEEENEQMRKGLKKIRRYLASDAPWHKVLLVVDTLLEDLESTD